MSEVSIKEVNLTEDLRKVPKDRRSGKDRRINDASTYNKEERRKGERRQIVRRQKDVDSLVD